LIRLAFRNSATSGAELVQKLRQVEKYDLQLGGLPKRQKLSSALMDVSKIEAHQCTTGHSQTERRLSFLD